MKHSLLFPQQNASLFCWEKKKRRRTRVDFKLDNLLVAMCFSGLSWRNLSPVDGKFRDPF